jgi:hypothetical protein
VKCILVSGDENLKERDYMEDVGVDGRIISWGVVMGWGGESADWIVDGG